MGKKVKPTISRMRVDRQPRKRAPSRRKKKRSPEALAGSFHIVNCVRKGHGSLRLVPSPIARSPEELVLAGGFNNTMGSKSYQGPERTKRPWADDPTVMD
jgi:hypothetical protein